MKIAKAIAGVSAIVSLLALLGACRARDTTITRGADGTSDWSRRLATAVPLGIEADSARAILMRNGFACRDGADSVAYISCYKKSDGSLDLVRRQWLAVLNLDARRHVFEVIASTDLVGP